MGDREGHAGRKADHLRINLDMDVSAKGVSTGLEDYRFAHCALPELDARAIDLSVTLFGRRLRAPLLISPMTGGIEAAREINFRLAQAAQVLGIAMGVGSQRVALDDPELAESFVVRQVAPDILLFANIGAVQLNYGYGVDHCRRAVEMIGADVLLLHVNPLQEALQPGGNTNFAGLLAKIEAVCRKLPVPVVVKEVGGGISTEVARALAEAGVAGIDVAGAGGTSWSEVERHSAANESSSNVAATFAEWGIPTANSVRMAREGAPRTTIIASGGIRTGLDAAKAIGLGADAVGIAAPLLKPATVSPEAVIESVREVEEGLRIAMFCIGAPDISRLRGTPYLKRRAG